MEEQARKQARDIIACIHVYDACATFSLSGHVLHVVSSYITDELTVLIRENKELLIEYFLTPPNISGDCIGGHEIVWECNQYGIWICSCYREKNSYNVCVELSGGNILPPVTPAKQRIRYIQHKEEKILRSSGLRDYWTKGA